MLYIVYDKLFLVHPTSIAAVDGSTVEFTCTANNTNSILYIVNDTSALLGSVMAKGFNLLGAEQLDMQIPIIRANVSVTVSSLYCDKYNALNMSILLIFLTIH